MEHRMVSQTWGSVEEFSRLIRAIDVNGYSASMSPSDLEKIQLAADYLSVLRYNPEAFQLQVLLLKQSRED